MSSNEIELLRGELARIGTRLSALEASSIRSARRQLGRELAQDQQRAESLMRIGRLTGFPTRGQSPDVPDALSSPLMARLAQQDDAQSYGEMEPRLTPAQTAQVVIGLPNGNFQQPPRDGDGSTISNDNFLPYWALAPVQGTSIIATYNHDANGVPYVLMTGANAAGGGVLNDELALEANELIVSNFQGRIMYTLTLTGEGVSAGQQTIKVAIQYLKADGTVTGSGASNSRICGVNTREISISGAVPTDAVRIRCRVSVVQADPALGAFTIRLRSARLLASQTPLILPDAGDTPSSYGSTLIRQTDGVLRLMATASADGSVNSNASLVLRNDTTDRYVGVEMPLTPGSHKGPYSWYVYQDFGIMLQAPISIGGPLSPTALAAATNNWDPYAAVSGTVANDSVMLRASATGASRNLTGLIPPLNETSVLTWLVLLCNVGTQNIVLKHDVTSTAAYRFLGPNNTDYTLYPNQSVWLIYDYTSSRWRVIGSSLSGALLAANNLSDLASASTARTNLGLGTMATQNASAVAITGGSAILGTIGDNNYSTPTISADQNNYSLGGKTVILPTISGATRTVTGFDSTGLTEGTLIFINTNASGQAMILAHASASSTSGNRFGCPGGVDLTVPAGSGIIIQYLPSFAAANPFRIIATGFAVTSGSLTDHTHDTTGSGATGGGATLNPDVVTIAAGWGTSGVIDLGAVTSSQDNIAIGDVAVVMLSASGSARAFTGMVKTRDYQRVIIFNTGSTNNVNIKHNVTSTAANRFWCPGLVDNVISPGGAYEFIYDPNISRWRLVHG